MRGYRPAEVLNVAGPSPVAFSPSAGPISNVVASVASVGCRFNNSCIALRGVLKRILIEIGEQLEKGWQDDVDWSIASPLQWNGAVQGWAPAAAG